MMRSHYLESGCILHGEHNNGRVLQIPSSQAFQREAVQQHRKDVLFLEIS